MSTIVTRAGKGSALTHNEVDANFTNLNTDKVEKTGTDPVVISANSASDALRITQVGTGNALVVEDSANPDATPFVITRNGNAIVGGTTAIASFQYSTPQLLVMGGSAGEQKGGQYTVVFSNNNVGPSIELGKSRSATVGTVGTIVQSGDQLGIISFNGDDGTDLRTSGATITAAVDGTPGTNDMPGRLVFSTTADGASSPTERMRIDSSGNVGIGTTSPAQKLHVVGDVLFEDGSPILTIKDSNATGTNYGGYIDFVDSTDARQGYIGFGSTGNATLTLQSTDASGQINFSIGGASRATITSTGNFQFNSGYGSVATAYGCRAWVNFNGTGTVAIRASGNVSSITDNGTGDYTVNFTTAMPDANYCAVATTAYQTTGNGQTYSPIINTLSVSSARIYQRDITSGSPALDNQLMYVAIFR